MRGSKHTSFEDRFWSKVGPPNENGCRLWLASVDGNGYGRFVVDGRVQAAHRVAYALSFGDPGGMCVCHRCDVRLCCEPSHHFLGTLNDNNQDRHRKGRDGAARGSRQGRSKLTEGQVTEIRRRWAERPTFQSLSHEYGVSEVTIRNVIRYTNWTHVLGEMSTPKTCAHQRAGEKEVP